ncbi:MAG TPA: hypothetical protein VGQ72_14700, partial [Pyrinomonadaceae bacterium]|nr:hypothetical protein [Pyrinomonadaceae bacterium]
RTNPPTRANCLYCGAAFEVTEQNAFQSVPAPQPEKSSENTLHIVALPAPAQPDDPLSEIAESLNIPPRELSSLISGSIGAPVFAANSEPQAQIVSEKLRERGLTTIIISDEQLAVQVAPKEIGALEAQGDCVVGNARRGGERIIAQWTDIVLIVVGRLYFATSEIDQKGSRSKRIIDEREMLTDETVLDLYLRDDAIGWRIRAGSFDFSCLGADKQLTAFANFNALTELLRERATNAVYDDSYLRLRGALNNVWPAEQRPGAKVKRRTAFGGFDLSATITDNELQFTRYSRLLAYLRMS